MAWIEACAGAGRHQLVDPLLGELHHEFAPAEHGEDLAPDPEAGLEPNPVPWLTASSS
jgi:hypothetical protein